MATRQQVIDSFETGTTVTKAKMQTFAESVYMPGDEIASNDLPPLDSGDISDFAEAVRDTMGIALVAGANVEITVSDAGNTITIASLGGGGGEGLDAEAVRDAIATALVAGNNIDIAVDDAGNTITIDVEALTSADISDLAEFIRDTMAAALVAGDNIDVTVDDAANTITLAVEALVAADISDFAETVRDTMGTALVAGNNIDITVNDVGNTITIDVEALNSTDVGLGNVANTLHNRSAIVPPSITDDSGDGYSIGSEWTNTLTDLVYQATDVTVGAAVWKLQTVGLAAHIADFNDAVDDRIAAAEADDITLTGGTGISVSGAGVIANTAVRIVPHPGMTQFLKAWTVDPGTLTSSILMASQDLWLGMVELEEETLVTGIRSIVDSGGAAASLTGAWVALYSISAQVAPTIARVAISADTPAGWNTANVAVAMPFTDTYLAPAGLYYLSVLFVGTTPPRLMRSGTNAAGNTEGTTAANGLRMGRRISQASPPSSITPSDMTTLASSIYLGLY